LRFFGGVVDLYLRGTAYIAADKKFVLDLLMKKNLPNHLDSSHKTESVASESVDKLCPQCGSLLGQDNREVIYVKDFSGRVHLTLHLDCVGASRVIPALYKNWRGKEILRFGKISNLWKLYGHDNLLMLNIPTFTRLEAVVPDGDLLSSCDKRSETLLRQEGE
jgi:hypothetical protein